ncbi:DUF6574 domain-containing protein [Streptococcus merionis]|uniref:DUF6574 domain-containing protein n=1 Tax=Streptococcus merionis TaxID=400065 RepID=UPI00351195F7
MKKQDWLDYFEAVNGRSPEPHEIEAARLAGDFLEEISTEPPTPPVSEPVISAAQLEGQLATQESSYVQSTPQGVQQQIPQQPPLQFQQGPATPEQQVYTMQVAVPSTVSVFWKQFWIWLKAAWKQPSVDIPTHRYNGLTVYGLLVLFTTLTVTMPMIKFGYMSFSVFLTTFIAFAFVFFAFILGGFVVKKIVYKEQKFTLGYSIEWFGRLLSINVALMGAAVLFALLNVHTLVGLLSVLSYGFFGAASGYTLFHTKNHSSLDMFYKYILAGVVFTLVVLIAIMIGGAIAGELLFNGLVGELGNLGGLSDLPFGY